MTRVFLTWAGEIKKWKHQIWTVLEHAGWASKELILSMVLINKIPELVWKEIRNFHKIKTGFSPNVLLQELHSWLENMVGKSVLGNKFFKHCQLTLSVWKVPILLIWNQFDTQYFRNTLSGTSSAKRLRYTLLRKMAFRLLQ